jgi:glycosyltransferase involved in cell wall biosynthesis
MKILIRQFLGKRHSWAIFGWGIADALIAQGHQVHLFSTDGVAHLPEHLKENLIGYFEENKPEKILGRAPDPEYDCQISYTCMKNFPHLLRNGTKNRLGVWVYEWNGKNVLPTGFAKSYHNCDYLISPSNFGKDIYINAGITENNVKVIPHGIDINQYRKSSTIKIKTDKKYKIFSNIAQLHIRKNIPGLLDAYGKAFNKDDDVTLILKAKDKKITQQFEISLADNLQKFKKKYPKHAEIKIFSDFVEDMSDLYRSVDSVYTMTHCEGFYMPGLEALAAGKLNIAPRYGGQLDFLNDDNSLLIEGKEERADPKSMYWEPKPNAIWFKPSIENAAEKLKLSYSNYEEINNKLEQQKNKICEEYGWDKIAKQMMDLCK